MCRGLCILCVVLSQQQSPRRRKKYGVWVFLRVFLFTEFEERGHVQVLPNSYILCLFMPYQIPKVSLSLSFSWLFLTFLLCLLHSSTSLLLHLLFSFFTFMSFFFKSTFIYIFFFSALFVDGSFLEFKWVAFYLLFTDCMWSLGSFWFCFSCCWRWESSKVVSFIGFLVLLLLWALRFLVFLTLIFFLCYILHFCSTYIIGYGG